jgi:hypothetical protein
MKIIRPFTATLTAALLLGGLPVVASADMQNTLQLDRVQFNQTYTPDNTLDPGLTTIAFRNNGGMPATDVLFAVKSKRNIVEVYDAAGSFAPGVGVKLNFPGVQAASDRDLAIMSVTYSDGSVWVNPDPDFAVPTVPASATSSAAPANTTAEPNAQY